MTPSKAPQAPRENPYEPLVQLAKQLPANTPAHQLAQRPVTTRREGINLYNALSPRLDSHRRRTVDHYFASLAGQKLKNVGIPQPPQDLTDRLSQVWLGQNPEENARTIMKKYPYSQGVLEEVMKDEDVPPWNPPRWEEEAKRFPKAKLQNLTWEEDIGEPVSEFEKMSKAVEGNRPLYSETLTQQDADKNDSLKNCYLM